MTKIITLILPLLKYLNYKVPNIIKILNLPPPAEVRMKDFLNHLLIIIIISIIAVVILIILKIYNLKKDVDSNFWKDFQAE